MRIAPLPEEGLRLLLDYDEAAMLDQLVGQLIRLLQSHSSTALDPDPLFASLEVGGSDSAPDDPALARLFPDAYEDDGEAAQFRRVSEQGLLNRKLQDAMLVISAIGMGGGLPDEEQTVEADIPIETIPAWIRTITALRLAIAARIGLEQSSDHARLLDEDETRGTVLVFDWLAAILESILMMRAPAEDLGDAGDDEQQGQEQEQEPHDGRADGDGSAGDGPVQQGDETDRHDDADDDPVDHSEASDERPDDSDDDPHEHGPGSRD